MPSLERHTGRTIEVFDRSRRTALRGTKLPGVVGLDPAVRQSSLFDGMVAAGTSQVAYFNEQSLEVGRRGSITLFGTDLEGRVTVLRKPINRAVFLARVRVLLGATALGTTAGAGSKL